MYARMYVCMRACVYKSDTHVHMHAFIVSKCCFLSASASQTFASAHASMICHLGVPQRQNPKRDVSQQRNCRNYKSRATARRRASVKCWHKRFSTISRHVITSLCRKSPNGVLHCTETSLIASRFHGACGAWGSCKTRICLLQDSCSIASCMSTVHVAERLLICYRIGH